MSKVTISHGGRAAGGDEGLAKDADPGFHIQKL